MTSVPWGPGVTRETQKSAASEITGHPRRASHDRVAGGQVVLPLGQGDVGRDVLFVQAFAEHRGRGRNLLGAVEGTLPGVAGALVAGGPGVGLGRRQALVPVGVHAGGQVRMLGQQRRVHPGFGVPEDVAVVTVGRQAGRRDAPVDAVAGTGPQVELTGVDLGGQRGVAEDVDAPGPQARPNGRRWPPPGRRIRWRRRRTPGSAAPATGFPPAGEVTTPDVFAEGVRVPAGHREG